MRVEMHSPPKEQAMRERFTSTQLTIIIISVIVCVTVMVCVLGGLHVVPK